MTHNWNQMIFQTFCKSLVAVKVFAVAFCFFFPSCGVINNVCVGWASDCLNGEGGCRTAVIIPGRRGRKSSWSSCRLSSRIQPPHLVQTSATQSRGQSATSLSIITDCSQSVKEPETQIRQLCLKTRAWPQLGFAPMPTLLFNQFLLFIVLI